MANSVSAEIWPSFSESRSPRKRCSSHSSNSRGGRQRLDAAHRGEVVRIDPGQAVAVDLEEVGVEARARPAREPVEVDVEGGVEAPAIGGAAAQAAGDVAQALADIGEHVGDAALAQVGAQAEGVAVGAERGFDRGADRHRDLIGGLGLGDGRLRVAAGAGRRQPRLARGRAGRQRQGSGEQERTHAGTARRGAGFGLRGLRARHASQGLAWQVLGLESETGSGPVNRLR